MKIIEEIYFTIYKNHKFSPLHIPTPKEAVMYLKWSMKYIHQYLDTKIIHVTYDPQDKMIIVIFYLNQHEDRSEFKYYMNIWYQSNKNNASIKSERYTNKYIYGEW
jgi:beta-glucanase (GH16 family)